MADILKDVEEGLTPAQPSQDIVVTGRKPVAQPNPDELQYRPEGGVDPFTIGAPINAMHQASMERGQRYVNVLDEIGGALDKAHSQQEAGMAEAVKIKGAVIDSIKQDTLELGERIKPLQAEQQKVRDRQSELAKMSPFKVSVLGIFDRNYNPKRLGEIDEALGEQMQSLGAEYEQTTKLADAMIRVTEAKYSNDTALSELDIRNRNQDAEIINQSFAASKEVLGTAIQGMQITEAQVRASVMLTDKTITEMTDSQLNSALAQAAKNGGKALVNGAEVSTAQIQERQRQRQQQDRALESQGLAIAAQRSALAEDAERRYISHLSLNEVQAAVDNGGVLGGRKLNQGMLTQALGGHLERTEMMVRQTLQTAGAGQYPQLVDGLNQQTAMNLARSRQVFGNNVPEPMRQYYTNAAREVNQMSQTIRNAPAAQRAALMNAMAPKVAKLMQGQEAMVNQIVASTTTNPDARIGMKAWLTGQQLTPEQSVKSIIAFTSSGTLPPGVKLTGPTARAFAAGQRALAEATSEFKPGFDAMMAKGDKKGAAQKLMERNQRVAFAVREAFVNTAAGALKANIPQLAAADGDPAGRIRPEDFAAARQVGSQQGFAQIAKQLGWSPAEAQAVFSKGKSAFEKKFGPDQKAPVSYEEASQQLSTFRESATLRALDHTPSARDGFIPSKALAQYVISDKFQSRVGAYQNNVGKTGLGEMLAESVSAGGVADTMGRYGTKMQQIQSANAASAYMAQANLAQQYGGNINARARAVLGAIPTLDANQENQLWRAVRARIGTQGEHTPKLFEDSRNDSPADRIDQVILNTTFDDPGLERIRKIAAKDWRATSEGLDRAIARLNAPEN